ncbi:sulfotransferase [Pontimonas sp.]|nr:sulfotransferase [Pontimonas sp.]MDA9116833.1 sulfotransferase [Pontimonas sp.]
MKLANPNLRVVLTVRNPIYRTWSSFVHRSMKRAESGLPPITLERFCALGPTRARSDVAGNFRKLKESFNDDEILLIRFDDIVERPAAVVASLGHFAGDHLTASARKDRAALAKKKTRVTPSWNQLDLLENNFSAMLGDAQELFEWSLRL